MKHTSENPGTLEAADGNRGAAGELRVPMKHYAGKAPHSLWDSIQRDRMRRRMIVGVAVLLAVAVGTWLAL